MPVTDNSHSGANRVAKIGKITFFAVCLLLGCLLFTLHHRTATAEQASLNGSTQPHALLVKIQGAIGPATADFIKRGIDKAGKDNAKLVILQMDTPGGLSKSMRTIIKDILSSAVPVVTYVAPSGARAASAGTFILYASHIAAMAPGTNLGAASPVSVGGIPTPKSPPKPGSTKKDKKKDAPAASNQQTSKMKATKDALAYIRSLAQLRNRNVQFAEAAVKKAATLTATEAKQKNVIDFVATDLNDLLTQINGRTVVVPSGSVTLQTKNLAINHFLPDWRLRFLSVITDPSVAYILMLLGIYGLFFEFANPGFVVPGVVGAIALVLALYAFQLLPISYAGLGLVILGIIFMVAEAFIPSFGALGIGGVLAFIVGSILLFDTQVPGFYVAWPLIFGMALANLFFFVLVMGMAIKARRRKVVSGKEELIGLIGEAITDIDDAGQAYIRGEIWQVQVSSPVKKGEKVEVLTSKGLLLHVKPTNNEGETK